MVALAMILRTPPKVLKSRRVNMLVLVIKVSVAMNVPLTKTSAQNNRVLTVLLVLTALALTSVIALMDMRARLAVLI